MEGEQERDPHSEFKIAFHGSPEQIKWEEPEDYSGEEAHAGIFDRYQKFIQETCDRDSILPC